MLDRMVSDRQTREDSIKKFSEIAKGILAKPSSDDDEISQGMRESFEKNRARGLNDDENYKLMGEAIFQLTEGVMNEVIDEYNADQSDFDDNKPEGIEP